MKAIVLITSLVCVPFSAVADRAKVLCPKCEPLLSWMDDPAWWVQNPTARATELAACRERRPGTEAMMRYCGVAARAAQMTGGR